MNAKRDSLEVINALLMVIDAKDHYTMAHSLQVMDYAHLIARELNLSQQEQEAVRVAGFLHDLGKIAVPDSILSKPGKLTDEEFVRIKSHPDEGIKIISQVSVLKKCAVLVHAHHERLDGSGYPTGRSGEDIPLGARILAVADVYSALTSDRPYRTAFGSVEAGGVLDTMKGQLDPKIVEVFHALRERHQVIRTCRPPILCCS
jgi:putative nucleotidyltransferase with HDIG domain